VLVMLLATVTDVVNAAFRIVSVDPAASVPESAWVFDAVVPPLA